MTGEADKPSVEGLCALAKARERAYYAWKIGRGRDDAADDLFDVYHAAKNELRAYAERLASEAAPAAQPATPPREVLSDAMRDVAAERQRQVEREGWTPEHDDQHTWELREAAICYIQGDIHWHPGITREQRWPWELAAWKPKDRRRNLVRAGALVLAEIERLDRAALRSRP